MYHVILFMYEKLQHIQIYDESQNFCISIERQDLTSRNPNNVTVTVNHQRYPEGK